MACLHCLSKTCAVVKVLKSFYGLTNAPRIFWLDLCRKARSLGFHRCSWGTCVGVLWEHEPQHRQAGTSGFRLVGIMSSHVDDVILAGGKHSQFFLSTREAISQMYRWGKWEHSSTVFAGMEVRQLKDHSVEVTML